MKRYWKNGNTSCSWYFVKMSLCDRINNILQLYPYLNSWDLFILQYMQKRLYGCLVGEFFLDYWGAP
jgi:hypothetical protein